MFSDFSPQTTGPQALQFGNPEVQCGTLPALQKKNIALWGYPGTPNEDQPARHSTVPQIYRLTWALLPFLTQPEPGFPGPTQKAGRTLSTIGPAMAFGHHLFTTSVVRFQNLDLISNHCSGLKVMQKSQLLPRGRTHVVGMLSNVQFS